MSTDYDLLIRNGMIYDGSGNPPVAGDVAINGETIAAIGQLRDARGRAEVDAQGLAVAGAGRALEPSLPDRQLLLLALRCLALLLLALALAGPVLKPLGSVPGSAGTAAAISEGERKIPEPTTPPMTIMTTSQRVRIRGRLSFVLSTVG